MHDRRPTRASRTIALLFALSLVLTACDSEDVLALLQGPVADDARPAAAAPAGEQKTADRDATSRDGAGDERTPRQRAPKRDSARSDDTGSRTPAPAPAPSGGGGAELSAIEQEIATLLDRARRRAGLKTLRVSTDVARGARSWSCRMARTGDFRHADLRSAGVLGENIAWGQRSAAEVHNGWMDSTGHRNNRMSARWSEYGVGVCSNDDGRLYFTERFR